MHPELVRIIAEQIQTGEIATSPQTLSVLFLVLGVIAIIHGVLLCKRVSFLSNLRR